MSKKRHPPYLRIAPAVRPHHGNTFFEELIRLSRASGALWEAFGETHLMVWPANAGQGGKETPEEAGYKSIEEEIMEKTLDALRTPVIEAFVRAATEVLDRERRKTPLVQK